MTSTPSKPSPTPYRQIRALQNSETVTLYAAFNPQIAAAAVQAQLLSSSPLFRARMTWFKPSWCWVCYRSGYGQKDANQTNILALSFSRTRFEELLSHAVLAHEAGTSEGGRSGEVRIQWDPERGPGLEKLEHRSIQIGVPAAMLMKVCEEYIVGIEDVTERAKGMQKAVLENGDIVLEELVEKGLHPMETEYAVSKELTHKLQMDRREG